LQVYKVAVNNRKQGSIAGLKLINELSTQKLETKKAREELNEQKLKAIKLEEESIAHEFMLRKQILEIQNIRAQLELEKIKTSEVKLEFDIHKSRFPEKRLKLK